MEKGTLYGVGVGPGDPELMTLKAVKTALGCDLIAVPRKEREKCTALNIALGAAPALAEKPLLTVDMPMTKDAAVLEESYRKGAALLESKLAQGKDVCFLTLGDPTVYSTYMYLHQRVRADGYPTAIVPGVASFCAAAAALGIPLCENEQQLHIIPATLRALRQSGASAVMVENCGMENEKIYRKLDEIPEDAGYFSLLIVK